MSNRLGQIYATTKNAEKYIVLDSQNVELSGNVKLTNGNLHFENLIQYIINNSLTSNNDASLGYVEISGNLNINNGNLNIIDNKLKLNNNTILEKRITTGSSFKCANLYVEFNSVIRHSRAIRTNGNNNYAMINYAGEYRIYDRYTKQNYYFTHTTHNLEAQFDYWHKPLTYYGETSGPLTFDEFLFGDYNYDGSRGSLSIYKKDEVNWNYITSLQNYRSWLDNGTYQGNKLHLTPDGSRLFWSSKTTSGIYMLYRGQRNRSYSDVMNEYQSFFQDHAAGNPIWNDFIRISNSIESTLTGSRTANSIEYTNWEFDSNTDGTILTSTWYECLVTNGYPLHKVFVLYSPTLKASPEGIFNMQTGNTNNFSDISGDVPDGNTLANKGLHNDYFIFQTILFNDSTDGIFNINYGYPSGNPNIDSTGPIGKIVGTNTTVHLGTLTGQILLYTKQMMSNDGLTLVVNDRGYDDHKGCIIILERPNIDVSFTYSTFFRGGDFTGASHGVTFGSALAIAKSDEIYAGSASGLHFVDYNFIINKIGDQWVPNLLEVARNSQNGLFGVGNTVNMSSDGNSIVGNIDIGSGYNGVEYYLKESNENFITSYGAIHNSLRADYIYNNYGAQLTSDDRYKIQEKIINNGLQTIRLLNPKKYLKTQLEYKADHSGNIQPNDSVLEESGLIAQELLDISNLNYVVSENDNKYNVRYNDIFIHGLAATKELDTIVNSQKEEIIVLKNALNILLSEAGKPTI